MGVSAKDDPILVPFLRNFHPLWRFGKEGLYSPRNLTSAADRIRCALGIISGMAFLESFSDGKAAPDNFFVDGKGLPAFIPEDRSGSSEAGGSSLNEILKDVLFPGKDPLKGKIPWGTENIVRWFRVFARDGRSALRDSLPELLEAIVKDGFRPDLPPLWSAGIVWEPPPPLHPGETAAFSPGSLFHRLSLMSWAAANGMAFVDLENNLPYPYASLEPVFSTLAAPQEKTGSRDTLRNLVNSGDDKLAEEVSRLLSECSGAVLWGREVDPRSREILQRACVSCSSGVTLCVDRKEKKAGAVKEVKLLWLTGEGEKWHMQNAEKLGYENPEDLAELVSSKPPLDFSAFAPLFPEPVGATGKTRSSSPTGIWGSAFASGNETVPYELRIRALIEAGQFALALSMLEELPPEKKESSEARFLKALALSRQGDHGGALKEEAKIKAPLPPGDRWTLDLLKAQALWLSGKLDGGREILQSMLKKEAVPRDRFRLLCQLSMHYLNSNNAFLAREFLNEARDLTLRFEPGPFEKFLLSHHSGTLERVADRLENALALFREASAHAGQGGYFFLEAWSNVEAGNILRLLGRSGEALPLLLKAASGARALRFSNLEETARFDAIVAEIEAGGLLRAEEEIRGLREARTVKASPLETAVENYWLSRILLLRGRLVEASEEADRGLMTLGSSGNSELRISLMILKGEILYSMNDYKALSIILGKLAGEEATLLQEPDLAMEYAALLMLSKTLKIGRISAASIPDEKQLYRGASPVSAAAYHLARAKTSAGREAEEAALKAYETGKNINSLQVMAGALAVLQKLGKVPRLEPDEARRIGAYIRENRITGEQAELLPLFERKKEMDKKEKRSEIEFLAEAGERPLAETAAEMLAMAGAEAILVVMPPSPPLFFGSCGEPERREAVALAGKEGAHSFRKAKIFCASGGGGAWGAVISGETLPPEKASLFKLWLSINRPGDHHSERAEVEAASFDQFDSILIGRSPVMAALKKKLAESAPFNFPVLLTGEPGTGKEVCARAIHFSSGRGRKPWTAFNCANLTPTLATSQLFGHKKGSFTGADSDKEGLVEAAKDSTLFLDEIGELPLETQAQFLRFLQDGSYQPLGANVTRNSNARIVAATNRNLEEEIGRGRFREDLYYRLKVISIEIPPLRERKEDLAQLFDHFLESESEKEKIKRPEVEKGVYLRLMSHDWPGNVRELQNHVRRLLVASHRNRKIDESMIEFRKARASRSTPLSLKQKLESAEKEMIADLLKRHDFNFAEASKEAGLSRQAFYQRAKKFGITKRT